MISVQAVASWSFALLWSRSVMLDAGVTVRELTLCAVGYQSRDRWGITPCDAALGRRLYQRVTTASMPG
ncbi:hypothetical protein D3C57_120195 [Streptomyces rapamycinicus NRRL 5491]|uniref:Uncharacterized protein n=1 Tax=Streptomyces rapamycinicus (strain ATCC 29253 / DSM 41530 / NRRL 5491 / AYB-994) TaxID=1343740 RepID=A0A3L8RP62_STRRN|nr:hypothetical protein D3C57_120195 [Streptomyces rapamycinicus NRRL 5491]